MLRSVNPVHSIINLICIERKPACPKKKRKRKTTCATNWCIYDYENEYMITKLHQFAISITLFLYR